MDPTSQLAQRFPLVARLKPMALPLSDKIERVAGLADTARAEGALAPAVGCFNLSALVASDCGCPDLARQWAHRLAQLTLRHPPQNRQQALYGLEPIVNLARLHIRAGDGLGAWTILSTLHQAILTGTDTTIDGITIPLAHLSSTPELQAEVRTWAWAVLLADGGRALTTMGRWSEAAQKLQEHRGIGQRMLDGRQIAIMALLTTSENDKALKQIQETSPGTPYERVVTGALRALCQPTASSHQEALVEAYLGLGPAEPGLMVPFTRLGLTLIDALGDAPDPLLQQMLARLVTAGRQDGYTARDILSSSARAYISPSQVSELTDVVAASMLDAGSLENHLLDRLDAALDNAEQVIRARVG